MKSPVVVMVAPVKWFGMLCERWKNARASWQRYVPIWPNGAAQAERSEFVKKEIRQRIKNMFIAWSPGERDFSAGHVADFYEQTEQYFAFDTLMPTTSIMKGWQSFADNWELALTKLNNFRCELKEIISLEVRGDVAWTGLRLAVSAVTKLKPAGNWIRPNR